MPRAPLRPALALAAAAFVTACDDAASPIPTTVVRLCTDAPFVAYRNDGAAWVRAQPLAQGTFEFVATRRVALAQAWGDRPLPYVFVEYLSGEQAGRAHPCGIAPPPVTPPPNVVAGVVRGWNGAGVARVAYGAEQRLIFGADSTFGLPALEATSDLLATRWSASAPTQRADAVIVRRGQSYPAGSTVALDFASPEAFALEQRTLRVVAPRTFTTSTLRTAAGQEILLSETLAGDPGEGPVPRDLPVAMLPLSRLAVGDIHHVHLHEEWRTVDLWTRAPQDLQSSLGAPLAASTVRVVASVPHRRLLVELPAQPEYAGSVMVSLAQAERTATLIATRAYFGRTPARWTLEVPDLAGIEGFPARAGLLDVPTGWSIIAYSQPDLWYFGGLAAPRDGEVQRSATASGVAP